MEHELIVAFISVATASEAECLAQALLAARLAACTNIISGVSSSYWWQGRVESAQEVLLVVKSRAALLNEITKCVTALHSYDMPEIIALPIAGGSADYLKWVSDETKQCSS